MVYISRIKSQIWVQKLQKVDLNTAQADFILIFFTQDYGMECYI